jgi:hypothetical protein
VVEVVIVTVVNVLIVEIEILEVAVEIVETVDVALEMILQENAVHRVEAAAEDRVEVVVAVTVNQEVIAQVEVEVAQVAAEIALDQEDVNSNPLGK